MKETRANFIAPPTPQADPEAIVLYIKRLNSLLPQFLGQMQASIFSAAAQTYDIMIPVPDTQPTQVDEFKSDITESSGIISRPTFSDEGGDDLGFTEFTCMIRPADDIEANLIYHVIALGTVECPQDADSYIGVEYNSGSPQVVRRATDTFTGTDEFRMAVVYSEGGTLHIKSSLQRCGNFQYWVTHRLQEVEGIQRAQFYGAGGIILADGGSNTVQVSAGELYEALEEYDIDAIDTSGDDTFDRYYRDTPSGWVKEAAQALWPDEEYDDNSGTLATLNVNKWASVWFYIETDGGLVMVYGRSGYPTEAGATAEEPPNSLPPRLNLHGTLIGRLIFQKSAGTATAETAFDEVYGGSSVTSHSSLSGLSSDDHGQYGLLTGRPLGQTYYGGTITGENLELFGNFDNEGTRYVRAEEFYSVRGADFGDWRFGFGWAGGTPDSFVHFKAAPGTGGAVQAEVKLENAGAGGPGTNYDTVFQVKNSNIQWDFGIEGVAHGFVIEDITNSKIPFQIEPNSPTNTLVVDTNGRIGVGTAAPGVDGVHVYHASDTYKIGLRVESAGTNAQVLISMKNDAQDWSLITTSSDHFAIRDVTGAVYDPFTIEKATPIHTMWLSASGNGRVGIGTSSPDNQLDVSDTGTVLIKVQSTQASQAVGIRMLDTGQSWQVYKETGGTFYIRDVTNTKNVITLSASASNVNNTIFTAGGGRVAIGSAGTGPATSAALEVNGTTGALLLTRLTTTQRNALTAVAGMIIYNTTTGVIEGYEGAAWVNL